MQDIDITLPGMRVGETITEFAGRLHPGSRLYEKCYKITERIERFMHYNTKYNQCDIMLAGSIGKETAGKDADLDLMINLHHCTLDDLSWVTQEFTETIRRHVEHGDLNWAKQIEFEKTTRYSVQFKVKFESEDTMVSVDMLPAVSLLDQDDRRSRDKLYAAMKTMPVEKRKQAQRCLSDIQVQFVKGQPIEIKDVILVLKHWIKKVRKKEKCTTVRSYFCELLVIDTYLNYRQYPNAAIDVTRYTKLVFLRLVKCDTIRIVWPEKYNHNKYGIKEIAGPMVLDPANPFFNVAPSKKDALSLSRRAAELFSTQCNPNTPRIGALSGAEYLRTGMRYDNSMSTESSGVQTTRTEHLSTDTRHDDLMSTDNSGVPTTRTEHLRTDTRHDDLMSTDNSGVPTTSGNSFNRDVSTTGSDHTIDMRFADCMSTDSSGVPTTGFGSIRAVNIARMYDESTDNPDVSIPGTGHIMSTDNSDVLQRRCAPTCTSKQMSISLIVQILFGITLLLYPILRFLRHVDNTKQASM